MRDWMRRLVYKEADIRLMKKKMTNNGNMESNYNKMLNNFTKQTTDQYKRYEVYLKNSEELLEYTLFHLNRMVELSHRIVDSNVIRGKLTFADFFSLEDKEKMKKGFDTAIAKFSRSQFLAKRKMFVNVKKRLRMKEVLKLDELQKKYDKLVTEENDKNNTGTKNLSIPSYDQNSLSIMKEKSFNLSINNAKRKTESRGSCKDLLETLKTTGKTMLETENWLDRENFSEITSSFKGFLRNLQSYLVKFKNGLMEKNGRRPEKENELSVSRFNNDVEVIKRDFSDIEKLEYQKLIDLREKNSNLSIIQNHIKNLSNDNQKLIDTINDNDFNLTVTKEIIYAYEKSMREKEENLKEKQKELSQNQKNAEELNQKVSDLLKQLMSKLNRNRGRTGNQPHFNQG